MDYSDKNNKNNFYNKSLKARLSVLFAGSFFNLLSAYIVLFILILSYGIPVNIPTVDKVEKNYIAENYFLPNDKLLKIAYFKL